MTTPRPQNGLTIAEMVRLYVEEHLTTDQIADIAGMSSGAVWARLREAGVTFRQRGNPPKLDPEDLRRWYVDEGQSTLEIANRTDMSTSGVKRTRRIERLTSRRSRTARAASDPSSLGRSLGVVPSERWIVGVETRIASAGWWNQRMKRHAHSGSAPVRAAT